MGLPLWGREQLWLTTGSEHVHWMTSLKGSRRPNRLDVASCRDNPPRKTTFFKSIRRASVTNVANRPDSSQKAELHDQRQSRSHRRDGWLPMWRRAVSSGRSAERHPRLPLPHVPEGGRCALHGIRTDLVLRHIPRRAVDLQKLRHCRTWLLRRLRYTADLSFPR